MTDLVYNLRCISSTNLSLLTPDGKFLLEDTTLSLTPGNRYGLIGSNGVGKTSLLRAIAALSEEILLVDQRIPKHWLTQSIHDVVLSANTRCWKILHMPEPNDPEDFQQYMDEIHQVNPDREKALVEKILRGIGFQQHQCQLPLEHFSGGWRGRVSLARALYERPPVLLLDESTNHLDLEAILWLCNFLRKWKGILVLSSHNIHFLNIVPTVTISFEDKQLRLFSHGYDHYKYIKEQEYNLMIKAWETAQKKIREFKKYGEHAQAKRWMLENPRPSQISNVKMILEVIERRGRHTLIEFTDVSFSYDNVTPILNNLNLSVYSDTRIALVGLNGTGKTTFLKLLLQELEPTHGEIFRSSRLVAAVYNQYAIDLLPKGKTAYEFLSEKYPTVSTTELRKIMGRTGLKEHKQLIEAMSGGQLVRVVMCDLQLQSPVNILILDEPNSHLDINGNEALTVMVQEFKGAVIVVSHDADFIKRIDCTLWECGDNGVWELDETIDEYAERFRGEDEEE